MLMKQFTVFKILTFSALAIAIFPVFTMDEQSVKGDKNPKKVESLELLLNMKKLAEKKKAEETTSLIKKGKPNKYMKYHEIKKLSKKGISGNHTVEITAYLLASFYTWECPNPFGDKYLIEQDRRNSIKTDKLYITHTDFQNNDNWES